jgi:myosin heavy subunit
MQNRNSTHLQDKNKDFVVTEHQTLLASSSLPFVAQLFQEAQDSGVALVASTRNMCGLPVPSAGLRYYRGTACT